MTRAGATPGATVAATGTATRSPSPAWPRERDRRAARPRPAVPFSEVSAHRATLEEAYLELTRDAVEFRAAAPRRHDGDPT